MTYDLTPSPDFSSNGGKHSIYEPPASTGRPRRNRAEARTPGMNGAEVSQLLGSIKVDEENAADRLKALRDKAVISLMLYSACRVSAVCAAQVADFYRTDEGFYINLRDGKERNLILHHKAAEAIQVWIEAAGITGEPQTPLFRSMPNQLRRQPRPFSDRGMAACDVWDMVKARCKAAGLNSRFDNLSFRVTALTNLLENGGSLSEAQQLAGHNDARTTALYNRRSRALTRRSVERINYESTTRQAHLPNKVEPAV